MRLSVMAILLSTTALAAGPDRVKTANGTVEGLGAAGNGVRAFKGIPFAAPPVGDLRWKAPQPVPAWTGVRETKQFGPRCMQLPVLVYFYGGGFIAGDGSEPRYDGESMAAKGIVALTVNYRLGVFGFMAHPELTKEAPYKACGNYALLDQNAALQWVKQNIAAFGGDPRRVTIADRPAPAPSAPHAAALIAVVGRWRSGV